MASRLLLGGRTLHLMVGRTTLRASIIDGASVAWAGEGCYTSAADLADAITRLAADAPHGCRRLDVTIERPPAQARTIADLPGVKARHLPALVAQHAGRFFRRNGQRLVTDAAWVQQGPVWVARSAAVEELLVEAIAAGARAAGLQLDTIAPAGVQEPLKLLPPSERRRLEPAAHRRARAFALSAAAIWCACGALFSARLVWERRMLDSELTQLAQPLAVVLAARHELRDAEATLKAVSSVERQRGRALAVLTALTRALPDSSVLTSLTWNADGKGELTGAAPRATDVVARLERLGNLPGVRLNGSLVREPLAGRGWERFTILFGGNRREEEGT